MSARVFSENQYDAFRRQVVNETRGSMGWWEACYVNRKIRLLSRPSYSLTSRLLGVRSWNIGGHQLAHLGRIRQAKIA